MSTISNIIFSFPSQMDVLIELPDLLSKLKIISYSDYQVEHVKDNVFITLFTRQQNIRYQIIDPLSQDKRAELSYLLSQYKD